MTCIAGVAQGGKVWMGADSAGVETESLSIMVRADEKVFRNGEFLMGFCGSFRARDIARYSFDPTVQTRKQSDVEYLVTTFIDELRQAFIDGGMKHEDNLLDYEGDFLLGYRGELYSIGSDFQVGHNQSDFNATGCGWAYALGSLDANSRFAPSKRVRAALECAERWSAGVRGPFKVISL